MQHCEPSHACPALLNVDIASIAGRYRPPQGASAAPSHPAASVAHSAPTWRAAATGRAAPRRSRISIKKHYINANMRRNSPLTVLIGCSDGKQGLRSVPRRKARGQPCAIKAADSLSHESHALVAAQRRWPRPSLPPLHQSTRWAHSLRAIPALLHSPPTTTPWRRYLEWELFINGVTR